MINILYVHGYNSSGNSRTAATLKAHLPVNEYTIFSPDIDLSPEKAIDFIEKFSKENDISIIVGSSLGGFLTLASNTEGHVIKIVINPSLCPSVTLPERGCEASIAKEYEIYEQLLSAISTRRLYGIFSTHDELIDYRAEFKVLYNYARCIEIDDGHRISPENITGTLIPLIKGIAAERN